MYPIFMTAPTTSTLADRWFQDRCPNSSLSLILQFCSCTTLISLTQTAQTVFNKVKQLAPQATEYYTRLPSYPKYQQTPVGEQLEILQLQLFFNKTLKIPPPQFKSLKSLGLQKQNFYPYQEHIGYQQNALICMLESLKLLNSLETLEMRDTSLPCSELTKLFHSAISIKNLILEGNLVAEKSGLTQELLNLFKTKTILSLSLVNTSQLPMEELPNYENLQILKLQGIRTFNDLDAEETGPKLSRNLQKLSISQCFRLNRLGLRHLFDQPQLKSLCLTRQHLTDENIEDIVTYCPQLETLKLKNITGNLSDLALTHLNHLYKIQVLKIHAKRKDGVKTLNFSEKEIRGLIKTWKKNHTAQESEDLLHLSEEGHINYFTEKMLLFCEGFPMQFMI